MPPAPPSTRSPFAGCAIFICVMLVMAFLVIFSIVALFRQYDAIAKFTSSKAAPVEITPLENRESTLNPLAERLETFRQALVDDKDATLLLSADDINLAIAAYEPLKELRGTFRVASIGADTLEIPISFPLNGKPRLPKDGESGWIASDRRFLNATLTARPTLSEREIALKLNAIHVPGAEVPREFTEQMSPYRVTQRYADDPTLGPLMAKLTAVEISDGHLLLRRKSGELPSNNITNEEVDSASNRLFLFFAIGASIFLTLVGIVLFIGFRAKKQRV